MFTSRLFLTGSLALAVAALLIGYGPTVAEARYMGDQPNAADQADNAWTVREIGSDTMLRRATKLLGKPLRNTQGEKLGTIDELVLTAELNQVSYAVLSRGGLFGFGERRYAIPWSAMQGGLGDTIVAPVDRRELEQDRGFRSNLWPSRGDPRWLGRAGERTEIVTYDVQPVAEQKEIRRRRVSHLLGMAARDPDDDRVGTVKDMVIALDTGRIPFTIVSFGGLLGLGNKYTAVPAGSIEFHPRDYVARVEVDEEILQANAFNPSRFPDLSDPVYAERLYSAYDIDPRDPDWTVLGYIPPDESAMQMQRQPAPQAQPQATLPAQPQPQTQVTPPPGQGQPTPQPAQDQTPIPGLPTPQTPPTGELQSQYLAIFAPENMRTIEGVVTGVSSFELVGTDTEWVQLQVRTDAGDLVTVHLGPRNYVSQQDFYVAANDRISLTGAQATAWRQPIILPVTATVSDQTITLREQSGRPLWLEPANGAATPTP